MKVPIVGVPYQGYPITIMKVHTNLPSKMLNIIGHCFSFIQICLELEPYLKKCAVYIIL